MMNSRHVRNRTIDLLMFSKIFRISSKLNSSVYFEKQFVLKIWLAFNFWIWIRWYILLWLNARSPLFYQNFELIYWYFHQFFEKLLQTKKKFSKFSIVLEFSFLNCCTKWRSRSILVCYSKANMTKPSLLVAINYPRNV